jgi:hypothetical protein
MRSEWRELTALTQSEPFVVERVRLERTGVRIEGEFELPPLVRLSFEDQVFIASFVRCHGSIKEMERLFGVSYPTIKSRLSRLTEQLGFVASEEIAPARETREAILEKLARKEIQVDAAVRALEALKQEE